MFPTKRFDSVLFCLCFRDVAFPEYVCVIVVFPLYREHVVRFSFQVVFSNLVTTWSFYISLCDNSINQSINNSFKSLKLDPKIAEGLYQWPENMPLGVQPMMQELTGVIRSLANGKAVGPDGVSVELLKIILNDDSALCRRLLDVVVCIWRGARCPRSGNVPSSWYSIKRRIGQSAATKGHLAGSARRHDTAGDHHSPPQRVLLRARGDHAGGTERFPTEPPIRCL